MAKRAPNLLELDVEKLFEERKVEDIVEIAKLLDAEIEKKRVALRSMVGDRYKDVLTASDQIKDMKKISEGIVENIQKIADSCEFLVNDSETVALKPQSAVVDRIEERSIVIQIRLILILNEQIWTALDGNDHLLAAELCLFAEHIYTGLSLLKDDFKRKFPILLRIRETTNSLRSRILKNVKEKLQSVSLTAEELGNNLNSLVLLENQGTSDLLNTFVNQRKIALSTVINSSHSSVRVQVSSMVNCLIATLHLLHDCFIRTESFDKGLIWQQLENVVGKTAPNTITKVELPTTSLLIYIPAIVKEFRPKCLKIDNNHKDEIIKITKEWLEITTELVQKGLKSLDLVTNLRGLHIIREEALKIDVPKNWKTICSSINLQEDFNVWYYYFQKPVTKRAEDLISKKIAANLEHLQQEIVKRLKDSKTLEKGEKISLWGEEFSESSRKKGCSDLSMKTNGFSKNTVNLCEKFDAEFLELLKDIHVYLYGKEYDGGVIVLPFKGAKSEIKFVDREKLETELRTSCRKHSEKLISFLEGRLQQETDRKTLVAQSLAFARLLQGVLNLCPNFQKCCTFSSVNIEWMEICTSFNRSNLKLWRNWVKNSNFQIEKSAQKLLEKTEHKDLLQILPKWETIEIQEQADDKIVKSQIKVPSHPSLPLYELLIALNTNVNEILPHTLPKQIHVDFIESCLEKILNQYLILVKNNDLHQTQALQFLFDVKFCTTLCIPRDNVQLISKSQSLCENLRAKIDPFDLDVFYSYLQSNVQKCVFQSQVLLGCLVPSTAQLASVGVPERSKEHERNPSLLALSVPTTNSWFPLLPVSAPTHKTATALQQRENNKNVVTKTQKALPKKPEAAAASSVRSGAAALWSGLANDWFS